MGPRIPSHSGCGFFTEKVASVYSIYRIFGNIVLVYGCGMGRLYIWSRPLGAKFQVTSSAAIKYCRTLPGEALEDFFGAEGASVTAKMKATHASLNTVDTGRVA